MTEIYKIYSWQDHLKQTGKDTYQEMAHSLQNNTVKFLTKIQNDYDGWTDDKIDGIPNGWTDTERYL